MQTFMIGEGTSIVGGAYWFNHVPSLIALVGRAMRDCVGPLDISEENFRCRLGYGRLLPFIILRWRLLGAELGDLWWVPIQK